MTVLVSREAMKWVMKMTNAGSEMDVKVQWSNKWVTEWNKSPAIDYAKFA